MADNTSGLQPTDQAPEVTTQDYIDAIKEAKASGKSLSINFGDLPKGVVAAAIHTSLNEGLPQEYSDAIGDAIGRGKTVSLDFSQIKPQTQPSMVDRLKAMAGPAVSAVGAALPASLTELATGGLARQLTPQGATDLPNRVNNFVQGKPNDPGQSLMQMAMNRPDVTLQAASSLIPGTGLLPTAARVAGSMAATASNPDTRSALAIGVAGGLQAVLDALPYGAGKIAPAVKALMSKASGIEGSTIAKLFDNPSLLFTGPNMQEAQAVYRAAARKIGLSTEVSDEVTFGMGKKFVKNVVDTLNHSEDVASQTLLDARQAADDLIEAAKRKGKDNMVKGLVQRRDIINAQLTAQAPDLRAADKIFSTAATIDPVKNAVPVDSLGRPSYGKLAINSIALPGVGAIASSPIVQGVATSAAGALAKTGPAIPTGIQAIRQYLLSQASRGPAR